jgi:eukaryotic-like serine/threonine-protein kinase
MASEDTPQPEQKASELPGLRRHTGEGPDQPMPDRGDRTLANSRKTGDFDSAFSLAPETAGHTDEPAVGSIIGGQYKILSKLGAGGMSHVYECEDTLVDRIVAIKVLRVDVSLVPQAATRFQREAKLVAMLEHPNIVKLYGLQLTDQQQPFIVMEMIKGESLATMIEKNGVLPLPRVIALVTQICDALAAAHAQGIVHRDLKPSNIMVTNPGRSNERAKVLDFGIAKLADDTSVKTTRTGEVFGSPAYMSPEQSVGETVDEKSDQYSLGCVIFEMLTGRTPFLHEGFVPMIMAHVNDTPPSLSQVSKKHFPAQIERTLLKLLEKRPRDRFASITEAKQAFLGKEEINQQSPHRALLSTRSQIVAGSVAILLLVVWLATFLFDSKQTAEPEIAKPSYTGDNYDSLRALADDDNYLSIKLKNDPGIETIDLTKHRKITDAGLAQLSTVHAVKRIDLTRCEKVTDAAVNYLGTLPLVHLSLHGTQLTNAGMRNVCRIITLRSLDACDTDINDDGCTELANLARLRSLRVHKTMVTGRTLSEIAKLKNLEDLDLGYCDIRKNLGALKALKLTSLNLRDCFLTDQDLEILSHMRSLTGLDIRHNNNVTDTGLLKLTSLQNLRNLHLEDCSHVTDQGIQKTRSALPHCKIPDVDKSLLDASGEFAP